MQNAAFFFFLGGGEGGGGGGGVGGIINVRNTHEYPVRNLTSCVFFTKYEILLRNM